MLEGWIVDLVPYGEAFKQREHAWMNNVSSFWSSGGEWQIMTQAMLQRRWERHAEYRSGRRGPSGHVPFGIQAKDGTPLGYMGINWLDFHNRTALLGAKIGEPEHWGGGYGTDALLLLLDYAFAWLDLRKAWLLTTSMNDRVMRQMEKVGFELEARQRKAAYAEGVWYDWIFYGLFHDEWRGYAALSEELGLHERAAALSQKATS